MTDALRPARRAALLLAAALGASPAVAPAQSATRQLLAERFAQDAVSVSRLVDGGRLLYESDDTRRSWGDYCGASLAAADRGEFRRAVELASRALYLGEQARDRIVLAHAARDLANAYSFAGDAVEADRWADRAIEHARATRAGPNYDPDTYILSPAYKTKGDAALRRGDAQAARTWYRMAQDTLGFFASGTLREHYRLALANADLKAGDADAARDAFGRAARSSDAWVRMQGQRGLAEVALAAGRPADAVGPAAEAVKAGASVKAGETGRLAYLSVFARWTLARALAASGQPGADVQALEAVDAAEALRGHFNSTEIRTGFFGDAQRVFDDAIGLLVDAGRFEDALRVSERSRARAFLDMLRGWPSGRVSSQVLEPAQMRAALPAGTVLVAYHVTADRTIAWISDPAATRGVAIPVDRRALESRIGAFRSAILAGSPAVEGMAVDLHELLVAPLAPPPGATMLVVPHRSLHALPFHALRDASGWLVESRAVGYGLSATIALRPPAVAAADGAPVAFGNPDLGSPQLDLPGAEREVVALSKVVPDLRTFVRADASRRRFLDESPRRRLVHVAAHTVLDPIDPMHAVVKLADDSARGGVRAGEIHALDWRGTELVTLSSCSSGLGTVADGDEFWGFKRAIAGAGARSMLVTLWDVDDDSTSALMLAFYERYRSLGKLEALRAAQRATMQDPRWAAPRHWAAFTLTGER